MRYVRYANELKEGKFETLKKDAIEQEIAGADLIDLNVGVADVNRRELMKKATIELLKILNAPISFDSDDPEVIEAGLRFYPGKALLNSTTAKKESLRRTLPIARKYGASIIGLTITEEGIPETITERLKAAYRIIEEASSYGIPKEEVLMLVKRSYNATSKVPHYVNLRKFLHNAPVHPQYLY